MNDDRRMGWLVRVPAIVLVVTAVAVAFLGVVEIGYGLHFAGPGAGSGAAAFGAALIAVALVAVWVGWAVWRSRTWAVHVALLLILAAIAVSAWVARTAFNPIATAMDANTGKLEPVYDSLATNIAFATVPLAIALACLVIAELRQRQLGRQH